MSALFGPDARVAWVFPGQGSQVVGMGKAVHDAYPAVRSLYANADATLGYPISDVCFDGPADLLQQTNNAQPALLTTEIAHLLALRERYPGEFDHAAFVAGHSLGEYVALVASDSLRFEDGLKLVAERGRLMQAASAAIGKPTGMSAIIGLPDDALARICDTAGVDIANLNAPGQVVISGSLEALEIASGLAKESGARRVLPLQVSGAFHSRWMKPMSDEFGNHIDATHFADPVMPVVANVTARPVHSPDDIKRLLREQTYSSVRWIETVQYMWSHHVQTYVEIGPGKVLSGLIKRIAPEARTFSSEDLLA
jgi:[acyl-carrier-protein] S-malonyltransferase